MRWRALLINQKVKSSVGVNPADLRHLKAALEKKQADTITQRRSLRLPVSDAELHNNQPHPPHPPPACSPILSSPLLSSPLLSRCMWGSCAPCRLSDPTPTLEGKGIYFVFLAICDFHCYQVNLALSAWACWDLGGCHTAVIGSGACSQIGSTPQYECVYNPHAVSDYVIRY